MRHNSVAAMARRIPRTHSSHHSQYSDVHHGRVPVADPHGLSKKLITAAGVWDAVMRAPLEDLMYTGRQHSLRPDVGRRARDQHNPVDSIHGPTHLGCGRAEQEMRLQSICPGANLRKPWRQVIPTRATATVPATVLYADCRITTPRQGSHYSISPRGPVVRRIKSSGVQC